MTSEKWQMIAGTRERIGRKKWKEAVKKKEKKNKMIELKHGPFWPSDIGQSINKMEKNSKRNNTEFGGIGKNSLIPANLLVNERG